jgi:transcriptional regulator GlxA family with amidase domain
VRLRASDEPLAAIAVGCGFVDQSHFTRAFARTFATSPGAYRRRYRA